MGKKQLVINLIANFISFSTSLLIAFVLTPYLIATIGKEAYGFYPISSNFVSYIAIITVALNSMASRFITVEIVKSNIDKAKTYFSSVFFANIIMTIILMIPMAIIVVFLESLLNIPNNLIAEVKILFLMIFASMLISVISSVFGVATFAKNRLDLRSGGEIIQGLLKLALYVYLFSQFNPSIVFVGVVALILSIVNLIIQVIFTKKLLVGFKISFQYFNFSAIKVLFTSGIWNSVNSLGSILLLSVSLLLANIFIGASASGELAIVQILPQFTSSIITMLFAVFLPRMTHVYAQRDSVALVNEVKFSQKVVGLLSTTPIILIILFGEEFFNLWVPTEDVFKLQMLSIVTILPLLIHGNMWTVYGLNIVLNKVMVPSLCLIGIGLVNILSSYIILEFFITNIFVIPIVSGIINILYYFCFIPTYAASQLKISKYIFHMHILKSIVFSAIIIVVGVQFKKIMDITNWLDFFLWGGLFGVIILICNAIFVLNRNDFNSVKLLIEGKIKKCS